MIDSELGKLSITRKDQDELVWDGSEVADSAPNDFCLVGKFLTDKNWISQPCAIIWLTYGDQGDSYQRYSIKHILV